VEEKPAIRIPFGDTDENGLPGYLKLEKNQISVEICALI
jgi:hypothetical protein